MSDEQQYARTGRFMFIISWLIFFALLFLFFIYYQKDNENNYQISMGKVDIAADQQGHYRIKGFINEHPVQFMIDTGATIVALPEKLAEQMQLQGRYPIQISTANGEVTGSLTRLKLLSFADFTLHDVKAVIIPGSDDEVVLLGMNVLSQFNWLQEGKHLIIENKGSKRPL